MHEARLRRTYTCICMWLRVYAIRKICTCKNSCHGSSAVLSRVSARVLIKRPIRTQEIHVDGSLTSNTRQVPRKLRPRTHEIFTGATISRASHGTIEILSPNGLSKRSNSSSDFSRKGKFWDQPRFSRRNGNSGRAQISSFPDSGGWHWQSRRRVSLRGRLHKIITLPTASPNCPKFLWRPQDPLFMQLNQM